MFGIDTVQASTKKKVALVLASGALVPGASVAGLAATVSPANAAAEGCAPPTVAQITQFQACIDTGANSNGLYVDTMSVWGEVVIGVNSQGVRNPDPSGNYYTELEGPNGHIASGPTTNVTAPKSGESTVMVGNTNAVWSPWAYEYKGNYCAVLWHQQTASDWVQEAAACISVS